MILNLKNLISFILFIVSPIFGAIFSLLSLGKNKSNTILYLILALFFSFILIKNPPLLDSYRYLMFFDIVNTSNLDIDSLNYVNFGLVSMLIDFLELPYYFIPFIFTFISIFILFMAFNKVARKYGFNSFYLIIGSLVVVILANPLLISMVLRFYLASAFLIFSIFCYLCNENKKMVFFSLLAVFFHFSTLYLILFVFLSHFINLSKNKTIFLSLLFLLFSQYLFPVIINYASVIPILSHFEAYILLDIDKNINKNSLIVVYLSVFLNLVMVFLFFCVDFIHKDIFIEKLKNIIYFIIISISLSSYVFEAFNRYFFVLNFLVFIYLLCYLYFNKMELKTFFVKYLLFFVLILKAFIFDFYIYRPAILEGQPISLAIKSPLFIFLYTDDEYRSILSKIDKDGYLIE